MLKKDETSGKCQNEIQYNYGVWFFSVMFLSLKAVTIHLFPYYPVQNVCLLLTMALSENIRKTSSFSETAKLMSL
jgi:hypothetical protein